MTDTLKPSDVVQLRSGGPKMTVSQVGVAHMTGQETVWCEWFVGTKLSKGTFAPETLKIADER